MKLDVWSDKRVSQLAGSHMKGAEVPGRRCSKEQLLLPRYKRWRGMSSAPLFPWFLQLNYDLGSRSNLHNCGHRRQGLHWKVRTPSVLPSARSYSLPSLSSALSHDVRKKLGVTHMLSVCVEHTFDPQPNAMVIPVQDHEFEDILIHLPDACLFIEKALNTGGRVLVHCVMGISRSATVVCAYRESPSSLSSAAITHNVLLLAPKLWYPSGYPFQPQYNTSANVSPCDSH